eukprot:7179247-Pyramimonas_sp.AAC.1
MEEGRGRREGDHPGCEDHRALVAACGPRPRSTASRFFVVIGSLTSAAAGEESAGVSPIGFVRASCVHGM